MATLVAHEKASIARQRGIDTASLTELMDKFQDVAGVLYDQMWPDLPVRDDDSHETMVMLRPACEPALLRRSPSASRRVLDPETVGRHHFAGGF